MGAAPFRQKRLPIEGACSPSAAAETQESEMTLVDLRSQVAFASGFIPGSFRLPDINCLELLRANGLLKGRRIYGVADEPEQIAAAARFWRPAWSWSLETGLLQKEWMEDAPWRVGVYRTARSGSIGSSGLEPENGTDRHTEPGGVCARENSGIAVHATGRQLD